MPTLSKTTAVLAVGATMALASVLPSHAIPGLRGPVSGAASSEARNSTVRIRAGARYDKLRQQEAETRRQSLREAQRDDAGDSVGSRTGWKGLVIDDDT